MRHFVLCVLLLCAFGSPGWAGKNNAPPPIVDDALAYALTDRDRAILLLEHALQQAADPLDAQWMSLHLAEHQRLAGRLADARDRFSRLLVDARTDAIASSAMVGIWLVEAERTAPTTIDEPVLDARDSDLLETQIAERLVWEARAAASADDAKRAAQLTRKALAAAKNDPPLEHRLQRLLDVGDIVAAGASPEPLEEAFVHQGAPIRPQHVVALLPLSGTYGAAGTHFQEALAFGLAGSDIRLTTLDAGSDIEQAEEALREAALQMGALAVVGPVLSNQTDALVALAESLHIPMVSLSQAFEDTASHHWALQGMYTRADQIEALLTYAMDARGMTSFAVFSPDSEFGQHATALFTDAVHKRQGRIATQATYAADEKNLLPYAKELGVREGNLAALRRAAAENGGNPATVVVPPTIDFDAIFLPESASRTPLACAALAYEEFPMGDFLPTRESPQIPLLGLSSWNTTRLVTAGNEYTRHALFPDVFSSAVLEEDDPFVSAYREETGRTPSALEASAVDVARLLAQAFASSPTSRVEALDALLQARLEASPTGATHFDHQTRRLVRPMSILTITGDGLERVSEVSPPSGPR